MSVLFPIDSDKDTHIHLEKEVWKLITRQLKADSLLITIPQTFQPTQNSKKVNKWQLTSSDLWSISFFTFF